MQIKQVSIQLNNQLIAIFKTKRQVNWGKDKVNSLKVKRTTSSDVRQSSNDNKNKRI